MFEFSGKPFFKTRNVFSPEQQRCSSVIGFTKKINLKN